MGLRLPSAAILVVLAVAALSGCTRPTAEIEQAPTASPVPATSAVQPPATSTPVAEEFTIAAVGDLMLGRSVGDRIGSDGVEVVFGDELATVLAGADITIGNLETAISERGEAAGKSYTFRAPPPAVAALVHGGFDVVSLANNHSLDYGPDALADTIAFLEAGGVGAVGAGSNIGEALSAEFLEIGVLRIAVVALVNVPAEGSFGRATWEAQACQPGVAWADEATVAAAVSAAADQADVVVALLHFGNEYESAPSAGQRSLAHAAVDAGAALVIGSHPHVLQEVESYGGGLIAYSLGNFVFDGFDGDANSTAILLVRLTRAGASDWELVPATVGEDGLPRLDGDDRR